MWAEILQEPQQDLIKQKEDIVYQILSKRWLNTKYPNFTVKYIQENTFLILNDKWVYSYCNERGEGFLNIKFARWMQFVDTWEAVLGSGYFEKKEWDIYKLYRVLWFDKNDKPVLEKNPIDPHSKEYYEAWRDIDFNATILGKTLYKKNPVEMFTKEELEQEQKNILSDIKGWAILIEDLEIFLDQKKITKEFFEKAVKKIVEEKLLFQCSDTRLDKVKQWITEERLKKYFEKGYINAEIAKNCILAINAKGNKVKGVDIIGDDTWKKINEMK